MQIAITGFWPPGTGEGWATLPRAVPREPGRRRAVWNGIKHLRGGTALGKPFRQCQPHHSMTLAGNGWRRRIQEFGQARQRRIAAEH